MESNWEREENNVVEQGIIDVCNWLSDSLKWFWEVQKKVSDSVLKCVTKKWQSDINVLRKLLGLKFLETNEERWERLKKLERQRQLRIGKNEEKLFIAEIIKDEIKWKEEKYKKQILPILARICNFIERKWWVKKNDSWELNTGEKIDEAQIIKWTKLL